MFSVAEIVKSNQIKFICDTNQNINECDIVIRQMCRQDTKAVPTALTGALGSKNTNYNSKCEIISTAEIKLFQFQMWLQVK